MTAFIVTELAREIADRVYNGLSSVPVDEANGVRHD
jgi:hypothetical protein